MNFQRGRFREEPEINLIPMIDVLLVILIFLMITTTYSKFSGLEINLPTADATQSPDTSITKLAGPMRSKCAPSPWRSLARTWMNRLARKPGMASRS